MGPGLPYSDWGKQGHSKPTRDSETWFKQSQKSQSAQLCRIKDGVKTQIEEKKYSHGCALRARDPLVTSVNNIFFFTL